MPLSTPQNELPSSEELGAYAHALRLLGMALYQPPAAELLASMGAGGLLAEWPLQHDGPDFAHARALMADYLSGGEPAALAPALRADFIALFVGPDHVAAPPWESVYLSRDHLLFDVQTLQVRQDYARFGLEIPRLNREPDDHISFELLFVAHLLDLSAQAAARGENGEALRCLAAARDFIARHPRRWVDEFAARLEQHAGTGFYRGMGRLLAGSLAALEERLNETLPPPGGEA